MTYPRRIRARDTTKGSGSQAGTEQPDALELLVQRLPRLDPILEEMKRGLLSNDAGPRPAMRVIVFQEGHVKGILILHFSMALRSSKAAKSTPSARTLKRQETHLLSLLAEELLPSHREQFESILQDVRTLADLQRARKQRTTCPVVSDVITDLATWFLWCRPLRLYRQADLYRFVGRIVQCVSDPLCLACGREHSFTKWRGVRMRDQYRDQVPNQRELKLAAAFGRGLVLGSNLSSALDLTKQVQNIERFLQEWLPALQRTRTPPGRTE